jgi:hypothetical protein
MVVFPPGVRFYRCDLLTEYRIRVPGPSKDRNPDYRLPWSHASLPVLIDFRPDGDIGDIERRHDFEPPEVRRTSSYIGHTMDPTPPH